MLNHKIWYNNINQGICHLYPINTILDFLEMVEWADKTVTF